VTSPEDIGLISQIKTAAYFQSHGFLVRNGVKLAVAAGTTDVTDIDVLALRFSTPLSEERLVVDCKDRKKPKPFERILWTIGLSTFSHANRAVVVLPKAPWQAREFASQAKVEVLCLPEIERYLDSVKDIAADFGEASSLLLNQRDSISRRLSERDRHLLKDDLRVRQMLVIGHPITNLNRLIRLLSSLGKTPKETNRDAEWLRRYICFNAAVTAGTMLVRFASESKWTPQDDWSDYARKRLTYGDVPPQKATQLAKLALKRELYGGLPKPVYTEEIIEVLRLLILKQKMASLVPYALDFHLLGNVLLKMKDGYISPVLAESQVEVLKLCKQILSVLAYAAEIPNDIWTKIPTT